MNLTVSLVTFLMMNLTVSVVTFLKMNMSVRSKPTSSEMCDVNVCLNACEVVLIFCSPYKCTNERSLLCVGVGGGGSTLRAPSRIDGAGVIPWTYAYLYIHLYRPIYTYIHLYIPIYPYIYLYTGPWVVLSPAACLGRDGEVYTVGRDEWTERRVDCV